MTSTDLIESVKRDISFPVSQVTFTEEDILEFANEEMMLAQVPSVMQFHEEYFLYQVDVALEANRSNYQIPDRAIGMKLRDVFFVDQNGNMAEMTRVDQDDRAYYQNSNINNNYIKKFHLQGNDLILIPPIQNSSPNGSLRFIFYLRPNQLVQTTRAAIIQNFCENVTVDNASLTAGDTLTVGSTVFTAVASGPTGNEFLIGATSADSATNLASVINSSTAATSSAASDVVVNIKYPDLSLSITTSNSSALTIPDTTCIEFDQMPSNITNGSEIDFLQTKPGHKTYSYDITIPSTGISGTAIEFTSTDVPSDLIVGDYICSIHECIIPQIPSDLHTGLADRTSARILSAIGDREGLAAQDKKIMQNERNQGTLIDNRVEGAPQKITNRHSLLRYGKSGFYKGRY